MQINKRFEWNEDKNQQLQKERDLSFERIQVALEQGKLINIVDNPKAEYQHQKIFVIDIEDYIVLVPFVEDEQKIFLKTAFKSRKANNEYRGEKLHEKAEKNTT